MKITIDTKEDSHEEIRKVIKMLQHLVSQNSYSNQPNIFDDSSQTDSMQTESPAANAFTAMFGSSSEPKEEPMDEPEEPTEEKEEIPEIIPY